MVASKIAGGAVETFAIAGPGWLCVAFAAAGACRWLCLQKLAR